MEVEDKEEERIYLWHLLGKLKSRVANLFHYRCMRCLLVRGGGYTYVRLGSAVKFLRPLNK